MSKKYRIVYGYDPYSHYRVQVWKAWFPFWVNVGSDRFMKTEDAKEFLKKLKNRIVWEDTK